MSTNYKAREIQRRMRVMRSKRTFFTATKEQGYFEALADLEEVLAEEFENRINLIEWLEERIQSLEDLAEFLPSGERGEIQKVEYEGMKQAYRLTIMKLKNEE